MKKRIVLLAMSLMVSCIAPLTAQAQWYEGYFGKFWRTDDKTKFINEWKWLDGNGDQIAECYYFNHLGYAVRKGDVAYGALDGKTPDGYEVNEDGAWVQNGIVQTMAVTPESGALSYTPPVEPERVYPEFDTKKVELMILDLINEERAKVGANPLVMTEELNEVAQVRAVEADTFWSHARPNGTWFRTAFDHLDYKDVSENLHGTAYVKGDTMEYTAREAVNSWLSSEGHRKNLLNPKWEETGISIYLDWKSETNAGMSTTQVFGTY